MENRLVKLAAFQKWANKRLRETLSTIEYSRFSLITPYGTLLDLIVHNFGAVDLWFKRFNGFSPKSMINGSLFPNWESLSSAWEKLDNDLVEYVKKLSIDDSQKIISYTSLEGQKLKTSIENILLHIFNHSTYHRGQVAVLLRENSLTPVKDTDYITFVYDRMN
ncbi:MAG: DinB family protein [Candidatus Thorarchaeota archaeon]